MKGPYSVIEEGEYMSAYQERTNKRGERVREKRPGYKKTLSKYSSNDDTMECRLIATVWDSQSLEGYYDEENTRPKYYPENIFSIAPTKGEDKLIAVKNNKGIKEDFPLEYNTEKEAKEVLEKLLGDC